MVSNLIEALVEWADEQPDIQALFVGGIYNTDAPTGTTTPLPYLTFTQGDSRQVNIIGGGRFVQFMTVNLEAWWWGSISPRAKVANWRKG